MGGGTYSFADRTVRATSMGYHTKSAQEIFTSKSMNNAMDPSGVGIRESRDSEEHPESLAIMLALDVTGSMGTIPHHLVKDGLPEVMQGIIQRGVEHPQVLFVGFGDHECDRAPLQVGQFESSDELLDKWLTDLFLEGGGGGNNGESYMLPWFFAANHTAIDCMEKRGQKGFLFTVGDEPVLPQLPSSAVKEIMGEPQAQDYSTLELLDKARENYNVYHLHLRQGSNGRRQDVIDGWKQLMGNEGLVVVEDYREIPKKIAEIVSAHAGVAYPADEQAVPDLDNAADPIEGAPSEPPVSISADEEEML
jgi:hypothetical protein